MRGWGPTALRLTTGAVFVAHGIQALMPVWGWMPSPMAAILPSLGYGPESMLLLIAGIAYLVGGLYLMAGAFTSAMSLLLAIERIISLWSLHLGNGFFLNWTLVPDVGHGSEYHLVMIAALLCLTFEGGGEFSIDALRGRRAEVEAFGRARLRAGKLP